MAGCDSDDDFEDWDPNKGIIGQSVAVARPKAAKDNPIVGPKPTLKMEEPANGGKWAARRETPFTAATRTSEKPEAGLRGFTNLTSGQRFAQFSAEPTREKQENVKDSFRDRRGYQERNVSEHQERPVGRKFENNPSTEHSDGGNAGSVAVTFPEHVCRVFRWNKPNLETLTECQLFISGTKVQLSGKHTESATDELRRRQRSIKDNVVSVNLVREEFDFLQNVQRTEMEERRHVVFTFTGHDDDYELSAYYWAHEEVAKSALGGAGDRAILELRSFFCCCYVDLEELDNKGRRMMYDQLRDQREIKIDKAEDGSWVKLMGSKDKVKEACKEGERTLEMVPQKPITVKLSGVHAEYAKKFQNALRDKYPYEKVSVHSNYFEVKGSLRQQAENKKNVEAFLATIQSAQVKLEEKGMSLFYEEEKRRFEELEDKHQCIIKPVGGSKSGGFWTSVTEAFEGSGARGGYAPIVHQSASSPVLQPVKENPGGMRRTSYGYDTGASQGATGGPRSSGSSSSSRVKAMVTVGTTDIVVKSGDLLRERADVLVSNIQTNLQIRKSGIVSDKLLEAGGSTLQDDAATRKFRPGDVIWAGPGNLGGSGVKKVYFVVLPTFSDASHKQVFADGFRQCLSDASRKRCQSIAFTSMGATRTSKYPEDFVVQTMIMETLNFVSATETSLKTVLFVIRDDSIRQDYVDELDGATSQTPKASSKGGFISQVSKGFKAVKSVLSGQNSTDGGDGDMVPVKDHGTSAIEAAATLKLPPAPEDSPEFTVIGEEGNLKAVERDIKARYKENRSSTEVDKPELDLPDVWKKAKKKGVHLVLKGKKMQLQGTVRSVNEIVMEISTEEVKALKKLEELKSDPDYLRKNGSRSEYLTCLTRLDKLKCPYYWTTHGKHLADIDAPTVKNLKHGLPLIGSLFKDLEKMIQKTFNPQLVGQGADAAGLKHTGIKVKKIEVIENPKQLRRYIGARAECIRKLLKSKNQQRFKNIEEAIKGKLAKARHGGPVKTTRHLTSSLKGTLVEDINEVFLLHGTKPDVADSIKFTGFDARLSFNGMYGGGLYFAEETTKADQYPDRGGRTPGDKHMLIVRTFLGYMYVGTTQPARGAPETLLSRAPCRKCPGVNDKCTTHHSFCDSVVHAADPNIFRELVIYDNDHCYPEFLVTYERQ